MTSTSRSRSSFTVLTTIGVYGALAIWTGTHGVLARPAQQATITPTTHPTPTPQCTADPPSYLDLSVEPSVAKVGDLVTLRVEYRNIGMPYLYFAASPDGLVTTEPPLGDVCKYSEHLYGCAAITFRALAPGVVTFGASATGEVTYCSGGRLAFGWGGGQARAPVAVKIDLPPGLYLPLASRTAR